MAGVIWGCRRGQSRDLYSVGGESGYVRDVRAGVGLVARYSFTRTSGGPMYIGLVARYSEEELRRSWGGAKEELRTS